MHVPHLECHYSSTVTAASLSALQPLNMKAMTLPWPSFSTSFTGSHQQKHVNAVHHSSLLFYLGEVCFLQVIAPDYLFQP